MRLKDALDGAPSKHERDSIENIAVTKSTNTNFSISNLRWGLKTKRHPMPYDPANFSFSYSHAHRQTSGKTTVYERDDQWRGALNYSYSPVYKTWEPFKKLKGKSKWLNFPKAIGINYLPQSISFNTEMSRTYYELQERDLESLENQNLELVFNEQFLWNRDFALRWDLTRNLHFNFQSGTRAQIEEPYTPVNKDLYPDRYSAWKDSVMYSIRHLGTPLDYNQQVTASYQLPLNKLPIFDWLNGDASYNARYTWTRGTELDDGTSLGNTVNSNRNLNINGALNLEMLYNHFPFLKKANERFSKTNSSRNSKNSRTSRDSRTSKDSKKNSKSSPSNPTNEPDNPEEKILPKNKNTYQREITLKPDTTITVAHNKNSKRLVVTARTKDGKPYAISYKVLDPNKIVIKNLDTVQVKLSIVAKPTSENEWWYKPAQTVARLLMSVRSLNISYRQQYSMLLPGFMPMIGDVFGQSKAGGLLSPGLDFAFGMINDSYIDKAMSNKWLLMSDNVVTPASVTTARDVQVRAVVEPIRDLKIDLNASHTDNHARSIQYMFEGRPTTHSGSFNMTVISLKGALAGIGNANNGYKSSTFNHFCSLLPEYQNRVQAQKTNSYGAVSTVDPYSAEVMVPAFLAAYTSGAGNSLDIFPGLLRMLPNWTLRYGGLSKLPWIRDHLKSLNLNHGYKSVYSVGSYTLPSIPTVSINEAFSPLLGVDATFENNLTAKLEYRTTRVINLSMTSVQINEALSRDWVVGLAYKLQDFRLFGAAGSRKIKQVQSGKSGKSRNLRDSKSSNESKNTSTSSKSGVNHDLNLRLDISFRKQASITRDIASGTSSASSGNSAFKFSLMADYTLSRLLTLTAFYDTQTNTPLLASSSYPTTTHDFGLSLKFSLTR